MAAPPPNDVEVDPMTEVFVEIGTGEYSAKIKKARKIIEKAIEVGNFLTQLTGDDLVSFPIIVEKEMGNVTTRVIFNKMELFPSYAELEIYAGVIIPQENGEEPIELLFAADGVKFSFESGVIGDATLGLLANVAFELGGSNSKAAIVLNAWHQYDNPYNEEEVNNNGTFITVGWDELKVIDEIKNAFNSNPNIANYLASGNNAAQDFISPITLPSGVVKNIKFKVANGRVSSAYPN